LTFRTIFFEATFFVLGIFNICINFLSLTVYHKKCYTDNLSIKITPMANKLGNVVKVVGLLTILGAVASKLAPLLKTADPKIKKKFQDILILLVELKDDVSDLAHMTTKEVKKDIKKTKRTK